MKYMLVFSLFLVGCGQNDHIQGVNMFSGVDPKLQSLFHQFELDTGHSVAGITGGFTKLSGNLAGQCVSNSISSEVRIDTQYFLEISDDQQKQLVYHELGHCALGLGHIDTVSPDGYYKLSIMNSVSFNTYETWYMFSRYNDYINALIHNRPVSYP